jgi:hypothetical protein
MTIEKIATTNMYFDYFAINTSGAKKATEDKALATQNAKQSKLIPIVQATVEALQVPAIPSDPTKFYKWDGKHVVEFNPSLPSKN